MPASRPANLLRIGFAEGETCAGGQDKPGLFIPKRSLCDEGWRDERRSSEKITGNRLPRIGVHIFNGVLL